MAASPKPHYLGKVQLKAALSEQSHWLAQATSGATSGALLGFELEPVVTLGVRGTGADIEQERSLQALGFTVERVDRGGQATLHNPGQLVIFPVVPIAPLGVKDWVCRLVRTTQALAQSLGQPLRWDEGSPGLYDADGKVVSLGVRVRQGVSTHGLAINIHNDLGVFSLIRACGRQSAAMSRLWTDRPLSEIFKLWCAAYDAEVDKSAHLAEFRVEICSVRS